MQTRHIIAQFTAELQNSDTFSGRYASHFDAPKRPFEISPGVIIPVGGYRFEDAQLSMGFGNQRPVSGTVTLHRGTFYTGDQTAVGYSNGRAAFTNRATFTVTPLMFFSGLLQHNSNNNTLSTNLRLRWEYQAGSELFVVYTDERNTQTHGTPDLRNRAFVIKVNTVRWRSKPGVTFFQRTRIRKLFGGNLI